MKPLTILTLALSTTLACAQEKSERPDAREGQPKKESPDAPKKHPEGDLRDERLARMKQEISELTRAGKHEEAERLMKEFQGIVRDRQGGKEHRPDQDRHPDQKREAAGGGDLPGRLRHLEEAIRHLREAGMEEPANNLENAARGMRARIEHGVHDAHAEAPGRPGGPGFPGGPGQRPDGDANPMREMHRQMQEMRGQMEKMNREMQEMREALRRERAGQ